MAETQTIKPLGEALNDMLKTPPFNKLSEGDQMLAAGMVAGLVQAYLDAQQRAEGERYLRRLMTAVYLHYHNRKDLDPIQEKHLELACEARKHLRNQKLSVEE